MTRVRAIRLVLIVSGCAVKACDQFSYGCLTFALARLLLRHIASLWRLRKAVTLDKITTVPKSRLDQRIGRLSREDVVRLNRAIVVFLGITVPAARSKRQR